jgi:hypothetical protein
METLAASGFGVVGPVDQSAAALVLAAQSPVSVAVIGPQLRGELDGAGLADELLARWGAPSVVLGEDGADWRDEGALAARLSAALAPAGESVSED